MYYKTFLKKVEENANNVKSGILNAIPFPFKRLSKVLPGIVRGREIEITANSGVGKSKISKFLFIFHPFLWCRENNTKLNVKILAFLLEESKEEFMASAYSFFLKYFYNIEVDVDDILSMKDKPLDDFIYQKMLELEDVICDFNNVVDVNDSITNPTGIFKYVKNYADNTGVTYTKKIKIDDEEREVFDYYIPDDENRYTIIYLDHFSLLQTESGRTLHQTMSLYSYDYSRKYFTKRYNFVSVKVHQQNAASEQQQFDNKGNSIFEKLEPSLSELADNKTVARDQHLILGLFAPSRYNIPKFMGYDLYAMRDNFRSLTILKNRNGRSDIKLPLYFNGACDTFEELPPIIDHQIQNMDKEKWFAKFKNNKEFFLQENNTLFKL